MKKFDQLNARVRLVFTVWRDAHREANDDRPLVQSTGGIELYPRLGHVRRPPTVGSAD